MEHASPVLAAIDLGTNNCRLLVATLRADGSLRVIDSFSRIVRLGEGVAQTGMLTDAAIDRTIAALKICAQRVHKSHAVRVRAIATEAARKAGNADVLIRRAREEAGVPLEIISPEEEARLAAVGCAPLIGADYEGALVFDIGGGSTEIIWMRGHGAHAEVVCSASVALGVVSMAEGAAQMSYAEMRSQALSVLEDVYRAMKTKREFERRTHHLLGTSGTVTTLAGIALGLTRYERARVDASWHDCTRILAIANGLAALDVVARGKVGCVGRDRADLIVPGSAVFAAIHAIWSCERLRVADRGLREGMLRELAAR
jgi:exopolyphosphatase/guanosine-5'-triphosphate,3'-diphosphate pyrophosphatase